MHKVEYNGCSCELYNKDSSDLSDIPDKSVQMIVTSPIYADMRPGGVKPDDYVEWFYPFAQEFKRVLVVDGNFILNINEKIDNGFVHPYIDDLKRMLYDIGMRQISKPYIWYKTTAAPHACKKRAIDRYEYCFWFSTGYGKFYRNNVRTPYAEITKRRVKSKVMALQSRGIKSSGMYRTSSINEGGALPHNVIELSPECNPGIKHNSPFPVGLPEWFIKAGTISGDLVLDPFMGSGTTAVASLRNERSVIGYEINKDVYNFSINRIEKEFLQETLKFDE